MGELELIAAIESGDFFQVALHASVENVNTPVNGTRPLLLACEKWHTLKDQYKLIIRFLIARGANVNLVIQDNHAINELISDDQVLVQLFQEQLEKISPDTTFPVSAASSRKRKAAPPVSGSTVAISQALSFRTSGLEAAIEASSEKADTASAYAERGESERKKARTDLSGERELSDSTELTPSSDSSSSQTDIEKVTEPIFIRPRIRFPFVKKDESTSDERDKPTLFSITINTVNRPSTHLRSEGQGDHTIAYALLMEMLFATIQGERITEAFRMLKEMSLCFLAEDDCDKIKYITKSFKTSLSKDIITRQSRKQLTSALRKLEDSNTSSNLEDPIATSCNKISSIGIDKIKNVIKQHERMMLLECACQVGEAIVVLHQHDPLSVFSKVRDKYNSGRPIIDKQEGTRVKQAMRDLKLLNQLVGFKMETAKLGSDDDIQSIVAESKAQFEDIVVTLNTDDESHDDIQPLLEEYKEQFKSTIIASHPSIKKSETINTNFNQFLNRVGLLELPNVTQDNKRDALAGVDKNWLDCVDLENVKLDAVALLFNGLFDFRFHSDTSETNQTSFDDMIDIASKHIVCIFSAFKHLNNLNIKIKTSMVEHFAKTLTDKNGQGWGQCFIDEEPLNSNMIAQSILEKIKFSDKCELLRDDLSARSSTRFLS